MDYIILKCLHIISSTILFGTGIGSAFYMFVANRQKDVGYIYFVVKNVVIADFIFTAPAVIVQLVTGVWLMNILGYDLSDRWLFWGLILYFFVGACWLPVVWMQIKMRDTAKEALDKNKKLPDGYWIMDMWWIILGSLAFPAVIIIFYLMVAKPL
jgi:uncharacterized membrane protein